MAGTVNRRKKLLIDGSQRQLLGVYFVHFMIVLVVFFAAMVFILNQQVIRSGLSVDQKQEFTSLMASFAHRMWPAMWVLFMFMVVHVLYISHKIAGPLYRIRSVLSYVATGNLTARARLRRGDYLKQDAATVNEMTRELDGRIGRLRGQWGAAANSVDDLAASIDRASRRDARRCLEQLRSHLDTWRESLEQFETTEAMPAAGSANAKTERPAATETPPASTRPSV